MARLLEMREVLAAPVKQLVLRGALAGPQLDKGASCLAQRSSGSAATAAACTAGCLQGASSTSIEDMFSPPEMMMFFKRFFSCI
jgi:hypothetical protein